MEKINRHKSSYRKALFLEYLTIAWNIVEGVTTVILGFIIGSISLIAYGLGSSIEIFSSSVVLWELRGNDGRREKRALKLIGYGYLVVALYIFFDASKSLLTGHQAERSVAGIILMFILALVMLFLGVFKRKVGKELDSKTVLADAKLSIIDGGLAATVLIGLLFNLILGWWWMDQVTALFLSGVAFREGIKEVF